MNHDHAREFNPPTVVIGKVWKRKHHLPNGFLVPVSLPLRTPCYTGATEIELWYHSRDDQINATKVQQNWMLVNSVKVQVNHVIILLCKQVINNSQQSISIVKQLEQWVSKLSSRSVERGRSAISEWTVEAKQSKQWSSKTRWRTVAWDNVYWSIFEVFVQTVLIQVCSLEHFLLQPPRRALWIALDSNDDNIIFGGRVSPVFHLTNLTALQVIFDLTRKILESAFTSTVNTVLINHNDYSFGVSIGGRSAWFEILHPILHLLGTTTITYSYDSVVTHLSGIETSVEVASHGVVRAQFPGTLIFFAIICCRDCNFDAGPAPPAGTGAGTDTPIPVRAPIACDNMYVSKLQSKWFWRFEHHLRGVSNLRYLGLTSHSSLFLLHLNMRLTQSLFLLQSSKDLLSVVEHMRGIGW